MAMPLDQLGQQAQAQQIELAVVAEEKCLVGGKGARELLPFSGCLFAGEKSPVVFQ